MKNDFGSGSWNFVRYVALPMFLSLRSEPLLAINPSEPLLAPDASGCGAWAASPLSY